MRTPTRNEGEKVSSLRRWKLRLYSRKTFVFDYGHLTIMPFLVFIKRYFLLLGFRDGMAGWILAFEGMASTFDAYAIAWDQQNRIAREEIESRFDSLAD
jgi:hypothetical protein